MYVLEIENLESVITNNIIFVLIVHGIFWGIISQAIASSKGVKDGFLWGFLFGIIGLIVVICSKGKKDVTEIKVVNPIEQKNDKYDQLEKIARLKDNGAITDIEYENEKKKILNK